MQRKSPSSASAKKLRSRKFLEIQQRIQQHRMNDKNGVPIGQNILRYGMPFMLKFPDQVIPGTKRSKYVVQIAPTIVESPVALVIKHVSTAKLQRERTPPTNIAEATLGFQDKIVTIETLQGTQGFKSHLDRFKRMNNNVPWGQHLTDQVEKHAKKMGFKQVRIRKPEYTYTYPILQANSSEEAEKIKGQMYKLYYRVAKGRGYREEGEFFVKDL